MKLGQFNEQFIGIVSATGAYLLWGVLPVYWKLIHPVTAEQILAHRIIWSFFFMVFILVVTRNMGKFLHELLNVFQTPKKLLLVITASMLITVNWFTYIWAVNSERIVETSLGYYINPLVSVLLGMIVLKEKLSFWQMVSFFLASIGVLNMAVHIGSIPWVALSLAMSFGLYGLTKKMVNLGAVTGITSETLILTPFALSYLIYVHHIGLGSFGLGYPVLSGLLIGAGIITAVPLILFSSGANRLPLSLVGFLQYLAPTIALILGVFLYHEPFTTVHLTSFSLIWLALTIFSLSKTKSFLYLEARLFKNKFLKHQT